MHPLIYDWNTVDLAETSTRPVMLDDETLRDGLQSPSVRTPSIDQKIEILHLIDALGIETADIGLPGAGPHVVEHVERLAREIVDSKLNVTANCAARTVIADIQPIVDTGSIDSLSSGSTGRLAGSIVKNLTDRIASATRMPTAISTPLNTSVQATLTIPASIV